MGRRASQPQGCRPQRLGVLGVLGLLAACQTPVAPNAPIDDEAEDLSTAASHPLEPDTPANQGAGDPLTLIVPRIEGGVIDLAVFAGRPYLLSLAEPEGADFQDAVAMFNALHARTGEGVGLVLVAASPDPAALDALIVPWELGWDPQGGLSARLEIAGLPTTFVVDARGQIAAVVRGFDPAARAEILAALDRAATP